MGGCGVGDCERGEAVGLGNRWIYEVATAASENVRFRFFHLAKIAREVEKYFCSAHLIINHTSFSAFFLCALFMLLVPWLYDMGRGWSELFSGQKRERSAIERNRKTFLFITSAIRHGIRRAEYGTCPSCRGEMRWEDDEKAEEIQKKKQKKNIIWHVSKCEMFKEPSKSGLCRSANARTHLIDRFGPPHRPPATIAVQSGLELRMPKRYSPYRNITHLAPNERRNAPIRYARVRVDLRGLRALIKLFPTAKTTFIYINSKLEMVFFICFVYSGWHKDFLLFIFKQCGKIVKSVLFGKPPLPPSSIEFYGLLCCILAGWIALSVGFVTTKGWRIIAKAHLPNAVWALFCWLGVDFVGWSLNDRSDVYKE